MCSDHFDGDRDYRRVGSVLRDAGQTMKDVRLKPEAVPSLRLPLTGKPPFSPAEDPASKRQRTLVSALLRYSERQTVKNL